MNIDVVTGGELAVAIASNFPANRINFHGNNKSEHELIEAIEYGIETITIDSFHEIFLLDKILKSKSKKQKVMIRVSPSIDPHTHLLTTTGILDSKFGFSIETGDAEKAISQIMKLDSFDLLVEAIAKQETSQNSKVEIIRVNVNPIAEVPILTKLRDINVTEAYINEYYVTLNEYISINLYFVFIVL